MAQKITYSTNFKRNYVAFFALFLFFLMIAAELVLALSIPTFVQRESVFAAEIRKRKMLLTFDAARSACKKVKSDNEIAAMEKKLLADALDYLAIYLRKEADNLTPQEVEQLIPVVNDLCLTALKLEKSGSFSQESSIHSAEYIQTLLKKRENKK